jgi:phenylacetate-CoA oxygenase PaaH subunit
MDTQWPRWEVFEQEREGAPYLNAGSVHAPDEEMALENARDVFVRRPHCVCLWVIPAEAIYAKTAQELANDDWRVTQAEGEPQPYLIFQKQSQRATETFVKHVGEVFADSPQEALALGLEKFGEGEALVWWVCPASAVIKSDEADALPMFGPAEHKPYRHPQFYKVVSQLREIKSGKAPC